LNKQIALLQQYQSIRAYTLELMAPLSVEDHLVQSSLEASPPKWHLGHTTWFFETLILKPLCKGYKEFDEKFPFYFNSYYEALGPRVERDKRGSLSRPALANILKYRTYVDEAMALFLQSKEIESNYHDVIELGLNHEQQHQELFLTDFKQGLAQQAFYPIYDTSFKEDLKDCKASKWIKFAAGLYQIGCNGSGFSFDNERPQHQIQIPSFAISSELVSNAEWLEFMNAGAYQDPQYWHAEGWDWLKKTGSISPQYWVLQNSTWQQFTLSGLGPLNDLAPVKHINFYEAFAFAQWKALRLPTEAEWEVAQSKFSWGQRWEWTQSAYLPYPGFKPYSGPAKEYNGKFMINQMVLRGASIATPKGHERATYRNFFHPIYRWQFTGLRLAKDL
jgi:ergothioneine biosynthesis protein EgtB